MSTDKTLTSGQLEELEAIDDSIIPPPWRWADWSNPPGDPKHGTDKRYLEGPMRTGENPYNLHYEVVQSSDSLNVLSHPANQPYCAEQVASMEAIPTIRNAFPALLAEVRKARQFRIAVYAVLSKLFPPLPTVEMTQREKDRGRDFVFPSGGIPVPTMEAVYALLDEVLPDIDPRYQRPETNPNSPHWEANPAMKEAANLIEVLLLRSELDASATEDRHIKVAHNYNAAMCRRWLEAFSPETLQEEDGK